VTEIVHRSYHCAKDNQCSTEKNEKEHAMNAVVSLPLEPTTPRMTANLLLIDDNAVQAATRQTILKRVGYFVIAALNPARALEQFRDGEFPEEMHLVITDHLMPGMSGAEFVRELRKIHPKLPVLVISGLEEAEQEYVGLDVTFRMKPLLPDRLLETVRSLVDDSRNDLHLPALS
jgi:DNA-binding NtrC family response regulator